MDGLGRWATVGFAGFASASPSIARPAAASSASLARFHRSERRTDADPQGIFFLGRSTSSSLLLILLWRFGDVCFLGVWLVVTFQKLNCGCFQQIVVKCRKLGVTFHGSGEPPRGHDIHVTMIPPGKRPTWNLRTDQKTSFLHKPVVFRFHACILGRVSGCTGSFPIEPVGGTVRVPERRTLWMARLVL